MSETVTLNVPLLEGADNVQGVLQGAPLPMLASAPAGIDSTRTGVPDELKPGILKLGMLTLGMLKLGMLGIPVQAESAAPHTAKAIARLLIRSYPAHAAVSLFAYDLGALRHLGFRRNPGRAGPGHCGQWLTRKARSPLARADQSYGIRQGGEARHHGVGAKRGRRPVRISELDRDHRDSGGARGRDVGH